jgi:hypothetical protein
MLQCNQMRALDRRDGNGDKAAMKTDTCMICGKIIR